MLRADEEENTKYLQSLLFLVEAWINTSTDNK